MFDGKSSGICLELTTWNAIPLILIGSNRFDPYQIFKIFRTQFRALKRRWVAWHWLRLSFKTSRDLKFGSNHFGSAPPMAAIFSVMVFLVRPTTLTSWIQFDNKKGSQDVPIPNALKMKVEGIRCEFLKHAFLFIAMNFKINLKHSKTDNFCTEMLIPTSSPTESWSPGTSRWQGLLVGIVVWSTWSAPTESRVVWSACRWLNCHHLFVLLLAYWMRMLDCNVSPKILGLDQAYTHRDLFGFALYL